MNVTLHSTSRIITVEDPSNRGTVPGRLWEGTTDEGIAVFAVVTRIAVRDDADLSRFDAELRRVDGPPSAESFAAIPARLVL